MPPRADLSFAGLDDSVFKFKISETRTSVNENESIASKSSEEIREETKTVRSSASIIEDWESDSGDECEDKTSIEQEISNYTFYENKMVEKSVVNNKGKGTAQREVKPVWNNARRVNHQNFSKMTHPHPKRNFVPTTVATKSGQVLVNAAKQSSAESTSTAKPKTQVSNGLGPKEKLILLIIICMEIHNILYRIKGFLIVDAPGNVVPSGDLTCLFAKATIDESNLWHRRLGHINFKTLNKLVRGNLVRDHLDIFDGKADEGFLDGYSVNSKAFRVFNSRTRKVKENLHVNFLENKPNVAGSGPEWLFDIDSLTKSMNYEPVLAGNQSNGDARDVNAGDQPGDVNAGDIQGDVDEISRNDYVCQGHEIRIDSSTHAVNVASKSINTASNIIAAGSLNINTANSNHTNMLTLEATGIFDGASDDKDLGA
nr:ribonuclease H-like domain-containing protein [Tanacetum cinerariifolium]